MRSVTTEPRIDAVSQPCVWNDPLLTLGPRSDAVSQPCVWNDPLLTLGPRSDAVSQRCVWNDLLLTVCASPSINTQTVSKHSHTFPFSTRLVTIMTRQQLTCQIIRHISSMLHLLQPTIHLHSPSFHYTVTQNFNQSINARFVGRHYTTRPGAPAIVASANVEWWPALPFNLTITHICIKAQRTISVNKRCNGSVTSN